MWVGPRPTRLEWTTPDLPVCKRTSMRATVIVVLAACLTRCTHACPLGLHSTWLEQPIGEAERVQCCGGFAMKDLPLLPSTDGQVDIKNIAENEPADVFLVPTSCTKLFDGDYPGGHP